MIDVVIGMGSNFDAENYLPKAVGHLTERFGILKLSKVYQSSALVKESINSVSDFSLGGVEQDYLNMAVAFEVAPHDCSAVCVIKILKEIESTLGRKTASKEKRQITIDLDLLLYGDDPIDIDARLYPAKEELCHSFVLAPLSDVVGHKRHAYGEKSYSHYWQAYDKNHLPLKVVELSFT